jgi:hypothetical protein
MKDAAEGAPLEYEYTADMREAGVPPQLAEPHRDAPGQMDMGWFRMLDWVFNKYENVSVKDVLQGEGAPGVKSGYGISLLQNTGMQPSYFSKSKLEAPFKRLGESIWEAIRSALPDEIELPVKGETGEIEGVIINHIISPEDMMELKMKATGGDPNDPQAQQKAIEALRMISVRDGDDRVSLEQYSEEHPGIGDKFIRGDDLGDIEFVQNDITFGDFDVSMVIDQMAEQNRRERMQRVQVVTPMVAQFAPRAALEYALKGMDEPKAYELLKKIDDEMEERRKAASMPVPGAPGGMPSEAPGGGASMPQATDLSANVSPIKQGGLNGNAQNPGSPGRKLPVSE